MLRDDDRVLLHTSRAPSKEDAATEAKLSKWAAENDVWETVE